MLKHRWGASTLGIRVLVHYFGWMSDFAQYCVRLGGSLELLEVLRWPWELALLRRKSARVVHFLWILCHGRFWRHCVREKVIFLRIHIFLRLGLLRRTITIHHGVILRRIDHDLLSGGLATVELAFAF